MLRRALVLDCSTAMGLLVDPTAGCTCLAAGTLVSTPSGPAQVETPEELRRDGIL
jgi:hypothetical protein